MLQRFNSFLNTYIFKLIITVILPYPISPQWFYFLLIYWLLLFFFHLYFIRCCIEVVFSSTCIRIQTKSRIVVGICVNLLFGYFWFNCETHQFIMLSLFLEDVKLFVFVNAHVLNTLKCDQTGNCKLNAVQILLYHVLLRQSICFCNVRKHFRCKFNLISQQFIPKKSLDNHFPID